MIPAQRNNSNAPRSVMATKTMAVRPAAGPETEILELLIRPTTIPPTIPAMTPDNGGAPDANAIPRQRGSATRNTTKPEGKFSLIPPNKDVAFFMRYINIFEPVFLARNGQVLQTDAIRNSFSEMTDVTDTEYQFFS